MYVCDISYLILSKQVYVGVNVFVCDGSYLILSK